MNDFRTGLLPPTFALLRSVGYGGCLLALLGGGLTTYARASVVVEGWLSTYAGLRWINVDWIDSFAMLRNRPLGWLHKECHHCFAMMMAFLILQS